MTTDLSKGSPIAVVTGANRGIGFETARQLYRRGFHLVMTARDSKKGEAALRKLRDDSQGMATAGKLSFHTLDVAVEAQIVAFARDIAKLHGRLDVLVNNAGIFPEDGDLESVFTTQVETLETALRTNTFGPFLLMREFIPLMKRRGTGRVVNVSSGMGQLSEMAGGFPAYRLSKAGVNVMTRIFAAETAGTDILVNSVCPGWVKTDMGGEGADRSVEKGAETLVWLATLPKDGPTGGFFRDREPIEW